MADGHWNYHARLPESKHHWRKPFYSGFRQRMFGQVSFGSVGGLRIHSLDRHTWYNRDAVDARQFFISYGYNPQCFWRGMYGKPDTFHWRPYWWENCRFPNVAALNGAIQEAGDA